MASWFVHLTPDQLVQVRALAGDIVLCSWARHFTIAVPLSYQLCKWVTNEFHAGDSPVMGYHPIQGGVEILLFTSCCRNWDKLQPDGPPGLYADFIFT